MVFVDAMVRPESWAWRDLLALAKPRLSALVWFTAGVGVWLAPGHMHVARAFLMLCASALVVGAANGINSYLERDTDALMRRTRNRPLPSGRVEPQLALRLSILVGLASVAVLYWAANPLTALLSFGALALYAWVYTPMKRYSWLAVVVGAVPGAIPPLMGWTAVTNRLDAMGLSLFAIMFFWQLPHFLAISVYLKEDYARGGLRVLPLVCSARWTSAWIVMTVMVLLPVSLTPVALGMAGWAYGVAALMLGIGFLGWSVGALGFMPQTRWARGVFAGSIVYLTLLLVSLVMGAHT